jgi:hypothetical protein
VGFHIGLLLIFWLFKVMRREPRIALTETGE